MREGARPAAYFHSTSSRLPSSDGKEGGWSLLGCAHSTGSHVPSATRRCIAASALASSSSAEKRHLRCSATASSSAVPSVPSSRTAWCGGMASSGSCFSRRCAASSGRMSLVSSSLRCATVPILESFEEDQRVANWDHPSPSTRISICFRRYSSFCASEVMPLRSASTSAVTRRPCTSHALNNSLACLPRREREV